ncbi:MAG: hypothetical protein H7235_12250 [Bdellovibrionaceae bacterium]|nr:hypothetical protein [Pseudobdellovibrionaceae bacterium]
MRQNKYYIFTLAAIFAVQLVFASIFMLTLDGSSLQKKHIEILESKNSALSVQIAAASVSQDRQIASIDTGVRFGQIKKTNKELDLTDYYFSQIEKFKQEKNKIAALGIIDKIQTSSSNPERAAQAEYEKINLVCTEKLELDCMAEIDVIISQFPDSNWTAKSLLLLSHYYYKQNRVAESKALINIIRTEFRDYNELKRDIQKLASKNL